MRLTLIFLAGSVVFAQGTPARPDASAYAARATAGEVTFAADYLVRAIPVADGVLVSRGYLMVDLAVFSKAAVNLSPSYFSLRLNGSKAAILAQQPFIVANSFDYRRPDPDGTGNGPMLSAGTGNVGVTIGGQPTNRGQTGGPSGNPGGPPARPGEMDPRIPDPSVRNTPPPRQVPETPNPYIVDKAAPALSPREQVERAALPSGTVVPPVSGVLFFAFQGKPETLRSVELIYEGPAGKFTLKLR